MTHSHLAEICKENSLSPFLTGTYKHKSATALNGKVIGLIFVTNLKKNFRLHLLISYEYFIITEERKESELQNEYNLRAAEK